MWKKSEPEPIPTTPSRPQPPPSPHRAPEKRALIGSSILIKGDLTGEEDLLIQGRLEGEVALKKNSVTVGQGGRVKADIYGKNICVEGSVSGNLYGQEEVVIRASGRVKGNIVSPRVTLENGANFKGSIDMEPVAAPSAPSAPRVSQSKPEPKPESKPASPQAPGVTDKGNPGSAAAASASTGGS